MGLFKMLRVVNADLHCLRKLIRLKSTPAQQPHCTPAHEHGRRIFENHPPPVAGLAVVVALLDKNVSVVATRSMGGLTPALLINKGPTIGSSNVSLVIGSKKFTKWSSCRITIDARKNMEASASVVSRTLASTIIGNCIMFSQILTKTLKYY